TSGLLVVAKHEQAHIHLAEQLAAQKVERRYEAVVHEVIEHEHGLVDAPIGRDPKNRQKMAVVDQGKPAVTHFHVLHRYKNHTHIACHLETGRTHQIRVHMKYIGHTWDLPRVDDQYISYEPVSDVCVLFPNGMLYGYVF